MHKKSWLAVTVVALNLVGSAAYADGTTWSPSQRPGYHKPTGHQNQGHTNPGHGGYNPGHGNTGHTNPGNGGYNSGQGNTGHTNPGNGGYNPGHGNTGHTNPGNGGYNPGYGNTGHTGHPNPGHTNPGYNPGVQDMTFYRGLKNDLDVLQGLVRTQRPFLASAQALRLDVALASRPSPFDRRLRSGVQQAQRMIHDRRWRMAQDVLRGVERDLVQKIATLGPGGPGGHHNNDVQAHREWIRDIRDLIDTLRNGDLRMARRDLDTLIRDVRQDGSPSPFNRQIEQRLRYIARELNDPRPRVREIIRDLQGVQTTLQSGR